MANDNPIYLPQQRTRRGKAGYNLGQNMAVVDRDGKVVQEGPTKGKKPKK